MDPKVVFVIVGAAISLLIGIWIVVTVYNTMVALPVTYTTTTAAITFVANNSMYDIGNDRIQSCVSLSNATLDLGTQGAWPYNWTCTTTNRSVKVVMNCPGGVGYCSLTPAYTLTYIYGVQNAQANTTFTGATSTVWNSISLLAVVLIMVAASAILAYFGFGRSVE